MKPAAFVWRAGAGRWGWAFDGVLAPTNRPRILPTWRAAFDAAFAAVTDARGIPTETPC